MMVNIKLNISAETLPPAIIFSYLLWFDRFWASTFGAVDA